MATPGTDRLGDAVVGAWYTATDSLSVVAEVLPAWAAHSSLAQVRLLLEIQGLIGWLLTMIASRSGSAMYRLPR